MSDDNKKVTLSLNVMINKERNKVLFAVADNQFVDILLGFLTLPLGRIIKVLDKQYKAETPAIGSLNNLYHSLANLDAANFWTEGAKNTLLDPTSSFEAEYESLKLDIADSPPPQYFYCTKKAHNRFRSVSTYYEKLSYCWECKRCDVMRKQVVKTTRSEDAAVFTRHRSSFIISDDLQILPNEIGLLEIINILGIAITDMEKAEKIKVDLGLGEIMNLLKASLTSPTPLSDIILNKTTPINSAMVESQPMIGKEEKPDSGNLSLKVMTQKSTVSSISHSEELSIFKTARLVFKAINNLYRSTSEFIGAKYFKTLDMKNRLMQPNLPHGCISTKHILPLTVESLPAHYINNLSKFSSAKFPKCQGRYLKGPQMYMVSDDLKVTPYCILLTISSLRDQKIPISDVEEVELQIGSKEGLSILKASLTSTSALTDALLSHTPNKRPKTEPLV